MAGTKLGGAKAAATNRRLYGESFYKVVSAAGGSVKGVKKGWYGDPARAKLAGSTGGSKRWEGRLGVNQAQYLSYVALAPVKYGQGIFAGHLNRSVLDTLATRKLVIAIEGLWHLTPKGEEYLISNKRTENLYEATSKGLKVGSDERSVFNFAVWFPFSLTMSLLNLGYVALHYYLILGTLWAR